MPIEDVLSSIRRLVSEEGKANRARTRPRPGGNGTRLVLTPSLRVADDDVTDTGSVLRLETPVNRPPFELTEDHSVAPATRANTETRPARAERRRPRANGGADTPWSDPNATLHEVARRSLEETGDPHSWDRFDFNHGPWTEFTETQAKDLEAEEADAGPPKADCREAARPVPIRGEAGAGKPLLLLHQCGTTAGDQEDIPGRVHHASDRHPPIKRGEDHRRRPQRLPQPHR